MGPAAQLGVELPVGGAGAGATFVSRRPTLDVLRAATQLGRTRVGLVLVGLLVAVALAGPALAPHDATEFVDVPNAAVSGHALLGTDQLGRDVLTRFLNGGWTVIWLAATATALGLVLGTSIGLFAAYVRGWVDDALMRVLDVLLAFPPIVLALLAVSAIGAKLWLIVVVVAITNAPYTARVIRAAGQEVFERDFIKAAEAAGEGPARIIFAEALPNVTSPLMVETGLRMTYSIAVIASLSFLGFGLQPPTADWGLMINENRLALIVQPWSVVVPAAAIGLLTVGFNLITDGVARAAAGIDRGVSA
jgi:peptide/nickel transport system permease protein